MNNTLESILDDLRSRLPASLRGAYLDAYVQRRRTPMELLLARSLPDAGVSASTFQDARSEIYALKMPQWVANRYLSEIEQALAVGEDTREVVARAKAWMATSLPATAEADPVAGVLTDRRYHVVAVNERTGEKHVVSRPDEPLTHAEGVTFMSKMSSYAGRRIQLEEVVPSVASAAEADTCHVCSETGKKSCTACGTEIVPYGAHGLACPKCAEQEIDAIDQGQSFTHGGSHITTTLHDVFEPDEPRSSAAKAAAMEPIDRFMAAYEPALYEALRKHPDEFAYTAAEVPGFLPRWRQALLTEDFNHDGYAMRGACKRLGIKCTKQALIAFLRPKTQGPQGPYEMDEVDGVAAQEDAARAERSRMPKMQRLQAMLASPPSDLSGWSHRITELYDLRMRPVKKLFGSRGPTPAQQAEYDAEKKLWGALDRKARAEHKRFRDASNAGLPPPSVKPGRRPNASKAPPPPDPTTRRGVNGYRSEADVLADTFNEEGVWQAEPTPLRMAGTTAGVRLSIYSEQRGHTYAVALATLNDNEVDVEWLSPTLTLAQRNEITRRLRTAAMTHGEDSEAPSPLQDLIDSTEKRALELGAKPARTRSIGRVTSDNPEERRLGEAVRDLRDRSEIDEAIKWLEAGDLNLTFDIDERTSELQSVDKFMTDLWVSILDTASIALGGVRGEGRGSERVFYVSPDMIFDADSLPFLLQRVNDGAGLAGKSTLRDVVGTGRATLRKVPITIVEPGDGDDYSAKVIDQEKLLTNDSMVHANELGAQFIRSLYSHMKSLHDDLERAPKALDDVRKLLYWTGAMLDTPRCQDATHSRALESFEAAKVSYDQARQHVVTYGTTPSELASIKAPLRKAAVSAAKLATDCGEGQVDIFSVRPSLPPPERPRLPSPDEMPSRWMSGDHVIGPNGENGTIVRLEDRGEYGWHLKLDRPPGAHWQSAVGFRRVSEQSHEPPPVPPESPETPLHQQDRQSVDVLDRLVAALAEVFIVTPIRSGHGYRVVDLRSSVDFGVYKGLPRNTYLTTVSLRHSGPSEIIGEKAYLVQSTRDAGLSHDQYRAIRQFVAETVERLTDEAQGKVPPEPEAPDDGEVTTKTFAPRMPTKYLRDFFAEKDIPEVHWTIVDSSGVEHMLSNLVVVEGITQATQAQAKGIGNSLRQLDFLNQDVNGYLKHLAKGLVETYANDTRDSGEPGRHRHDLLTDEGQPSAVAEQGDEQTAADSPRAVTWSDLRKGDLVWDPKSDDYDLLLVTRRGATSHWWTTSGIMQKTGGTTIAVDGTAQHSWSYGPADPAHVLILVGRDVKPYSANVRAAWVSAKDAAQQLAEFY